MQTLSLSYTFTDHSSKNNGVGALSLPEQGASAVRHTHRVQLIDSAAFSPQLRNEIILVFKDQTSRSGSQADGPEILVNGVFVGGPSQSFNDKERCAFDIQDTATYIRGKHSFLRGATVRNDWSYVFDATTLGGTWYVSRCDPY